ncbi:MAG: DotH/IcmK family type IV secretion protein [Gammaproteobacteria bacterium]
MMKIIKIPFSILLSLVLCTPLFAQNEQNQQSQQMLEQVRQLQQQQQETLSKQNAMIAQQAKQYMQGQLYGTGGGPGVGPILPASNFKAPFTSERPLQNLQTQSVNQSSFANTAQNLLPMSPDQIHRLKQLYTASQYAAAAPAGVPPKPTASSLFVDLSPGATPPAINLAEGDITALVFLDSTGAPWPIEALDNGNPTAFNIQWNKKDNVLMIQASTAFGHGNLAVRLRNLGTPVMITLVTNSAVESGGVVNYRVDLRIPGFGPNAYPAPVSGLPGDVANVLLSVLEGIPPSGSRALHIDEEMGYVWLLEDKIYLRTRWTLLSPAWLQTMSSADGTHAYQLLKTPLLLMSQNGKMVQVKVTGF